MNADDVCVNIYVYTWCVCVYTFSAWNPSKDNPIVHFAESVFKVPSAGQKMLTQRKPKGYRNEVPKSFLLPTEQHAWVEKKTGEKGVAGDTEDRSEHLDKAPIQTGDSACTRERPEQAPRRRWSGSGSLRGKEDPGGDWKRCRRVPTIGNRQRAQCI